MNKIIISEKFAMFTEEWTPKIIAESNGQLVKIAKGTGELILCVAYKTSKKRGVG